MKTIGMEEYWTLRDELVAHEQALLRALAFDTEPTLAYVFLAEFAWIVRCDKGDQGLASLAWTLLNDAFCSELCALWAPAQIALACLLLAVELGRRCPAHRAEAGRVANSVERICKEGQLERFFGLGPGKGAEALEEICKELLDAYAADQQGETP